jgi:hypothetical protein
LTRGLHLGQVHAGAKGRTCSGNDDGPHLSLAVKVVQRLVDVGNELARKRVALFRTIEDQRAGVLVNVSLD